MRSSPTVVAIFAILAAGAAPALAYFELELVSGGTMTADSYVEEEDAYRLYRPGGELRVDKARVAAIRERDGRLTAPVAPEPAPAVPAAKPATPAGRVAPAAAEPLPQDPAALREMERKLTRDIILGYRDRLFAKNRGEDEEELKRRKNEIEALEDRRERVQTKLESR